MLIPRYLKVLGLVGATAFALVSLPGCDRHTNAIKADAAMVAGYGNRVETAGVEVVRLADTIVPAIAKGDDKAITNAVVGLKNIGNDLETTGQKLQSTGGRLTANAEHVKDKTSLFAWILANLFVIAAVVAGIVLFWPVAGPALLALIPVFGHAIAWLVGRWSKAAFLIPGSIREKAKLDAEALNATPDNPAVNASVTASRARSPLYDAAFRISKK